MAVQFIKAHHSSTQETTLYISLPTVVSEVVLAVSEQHLILTSILKIRTGNPAHWTNMGIVPASLFENERGLTVVTFDQALDAVMMLMCWQYVIGGHEAAAVVVTHSEFRALCVCTNV